MGSNKTLLAILLKKQSGSKNLGNFEWHRFLKSLHSLFKIRRYMKVLEKFVEKKNYKYNFFPKHSKSMHFFRNTHSPHIKWKIFYTSNFLLPKFMLLISLFSNFFCLNLRRKNRNKIFSFLLHTPNAGVGSGGSQAFGPYLCHGSRDPTVSSITRSLSESA